LADAGPAIPITAFVLDNWAVRRAHSFTVIVGVLRWKCCSVRLTAFVSCANLPIRHRARCFQKIFTARLSIASMPFPAQLISLARKAAAAQSLDPALVCAVVEQESSWNPWAMRYEPLFFAKYVASLYTTSKISASEAYARGFSWGLMQVMGQVARESGFDAPFLSALCDPEQALALGCKVLRKKFDAASNDPTRALLSWNGGANPAYPAQVLARKSHYF